MRLAERDYPRRARSQSRAELHTQSSELSHQPSVNVSTVRVAAAQFETSAEVDTNLARCVESVDEAAGRGARLIVLPEFCNHYSVYEDAQHCREVALARNGRFIRSVAERARRHRVFVVLTVTLRRSFGVTVTSLMIDDQGEIAAEADKQTLMGNERAYLQPGPNVAPVTATPWGSVGMYSCMDGVTPEVPRALSLRGARILTNCLNSFAADEASLHVPVRALENQVFVVAANKVGPLVGADRLEPMAHALGIDSEALHGAGESQIVAPDGSVVAKASRRRREVVVATIDVHEVQRRRAASPLPLRRPRLYSALAEPCTQAPSARTAESLRVGVAVNAAAAQRALDDDAELVVLPELSPLPRRISPGVTVVTTRRDGVSHTGIVVGASGEIAQQPQLHETKRLPWAATLGQRLHTVDLRWGRLGVVIGDDICHPEVARLAAIEGVSLLAVCHQPTEDAQVDLALVERAAENRICLVAAAAPGPVVGSAVINPPADSLWSTDRKRPFDGTINLAVIERLDPSSDCLLTTAYPSRSHQREVSRDPDLVGGRSLAAAEVLCRHKTE